MESPEQQSIFPYLTLNIEDDFRLVEIQPGTSTDPVSCHLFSTRLRDLPTYEALSYTWGDQGNKELVTCKEGDQESFSLAVTANCALALRRLRLEDSPRVVWIDSICINQSKISERNHQVGLMGRIYSQASMVVIYLGEATEDSDEALDWIQKIHDPDYGYEAPKSRYRILGPRVIRPETKSKGTSF